MVPNIFLGVLMNTHQLTKQWFVAIRCLTWRNSVNGQQSMHWFEKSRLRKRTICDRCHVDIGCSRVRGGSAYMSQWTSDRFACRSVRNTSLLSYAYPQVKNIWGSKSVAWTIQNRFSQKFSDKGHGRGTSVWLKIIVWLNFILGLNFISLCFKLIIKHQQTKNRKLSLKPSRTKFNYKKNYTNPTKKCFCNKKDSWEIERMHANVVELINTGYPYNTPNTRTLSNALTTGFFIAQFPVFVSSLIGLRLCLSEFLFRESPILSIFLEFFLAGFECQWCEHSVVRS